MIEDFDVDRQSQLFFKSERERYFVFYIIVRMRTAVTDKNGHIDVPEFFSLNERAMQVSKDDLILPGEDVFEFPDRSLEINFFSGHDYSDSTD